MNWLHFSVWVAGLYLLYYLVNILIDVAGSGNAPAASFTTNELTFSEDHQPQKMEHVIETAPEKPAKPLAKSEIIASGGVPVKDIFSLVKQEAVIYTRAVSFY